MASKSDNIAYVYWIHYPEHSDMFSEGYIGVSIDPQKRLKRHFCLIEGGWHENPHLKRVFNKHKDKIVQSVILCGTEEYCYELESKLRPNKQIGWNIAEGGFAPPKMMGHKFNKGRIRSKEEIEKSSKALKEYWAVKSPIEDRKKVIKFGSDEYRQMMREIKTGFVHSDDSKEKMRQRQKGKSCPSKGIPWWTNGKENKRQMDQPSEEWYQGRTTKKQEFSDEERKRRSDRIKIINARKKRQ